MVAFLILALMVAVAMVLRLPGRLIWGAAAIYWAGIVVAHLVLPVGAALPVATGGSLASWLVMGGVAGAVVAYRAVLGRLRVRALPVSTAATPVPRPGSLSDAELDRYARHIVLREIGGTGQKRLKAAKVLVVGAGGLGSPALLYLAAAGVGTIGVIDDDTVSNANLQRQIIHTDDRIGMPKVFSAEAAIRALNPFVTVRPYNRRLAGAEAPALFAEYDLILDGSDNFDTRYLVNAAAVAAGKPLLSGAITQWEGQLSLYDPARGAPCFACVFPDRPAAGLAPSCAEAGVMGALPGIVGATMAAEAIKEITGAGEGLRGRLMLFDALWGENRMVAVERRADCTVCGHLSRG
jgi:molybdopterin/thiamine biosynthesis adenylyltransferase